MLDLRKVNDSSFARAKRLWMYSILMKISAFMIGSYSVFASSPNRYIPQLLLGLVVASELYQWRSDIHKSRAESLLRNLDICRSFQREISAADKRDIASYVPRKLRKKFDAETVVDNYFASIQAPGPRRSVENLIESAWYTWKQAEIMVGVCIVIIAILTGISIFALIVASQELNNASTRADVNRVVTSWLLLLFSLGLIKYAWSYYKFYHRGQKTEATGIFLSKSSEITEADALKQWYEYQIARASAPLLPKWLWWIMKPSLDDAWRRSKEEQS